MRHGVTHSLIYQFHHLDLATSSQDKIEEIFRQVSFPWYCYIAHTHKVIQSCLLQKEEHTHN